MTEIDNQSFTPLRMAFYALPRTCQIDSGIRLAIGDRLLECLRQEMTDEEIAAAHDELEPEFSRMRAVTCARCNILQCVHNLRRPDDIFRQLQQLSWNERRQLAEKVLHELPLPAMSEEFKVTTFSFHSRRNPRLSVTVTNKTTGEKLSITAEIGMKVIDVNGRELPLLGLQQFQSVVRQTVSEFIHPKA